MRVRGVRTVIKVSLVMTAFAVIRCDDGISIKSEADFIKFELNTTRLYQFKDSVFQVCSPAYYNPDKFDFHIHKQFDSDDSEFQSMTLTVDKRESDCPTTRIDNDSEFIFTLTRKDGFDFVDYTTLAGFNKISWTQEYRDKKIILKGKFDGWLYKYFPKRRVEAIEPQQLDSVLISHGEFQLTLE